jgi:hypothetical protein
MRRKKQRVCPICEKDLNPGELYFIIPLEYPYQNMKIHRLCSKNDQRIQELLYNKNKGLNKNDYRLT